MTTTETNHAERNATGHAQTIEALYELSCWDTDQSQPLTLEAHSVLDDLDWDAETGTPEILQEAITDYANGMPLSVLVRSGWYIPGTAPGYAEEFEILLSTGGPACRIIGQLDAGSVAWQSRVWVSCVG